MKKDSSEQQQRVLRKLIRLHKPTLQTMSTPITRKSTTPFPVGRRTTRSEAAKLRAEKELHGKVSPTNKLEAKHTDDSTESIDSQLDFHKQNTNVPSTKTNDSQSETNSQMETVEDKSAKRPRKKRISRTLFRHDNIDYIKPKKQELLQKSFSCNFKKLVHKSKEIYTKNDDLQNDEETEISNKKTTEEIQEDEKINHVTKIPDNPSTCNEAKTQQNSDKKIQYKYKLILDMPSLDSPKPQTENLINRVGNNAKNSKIHLQKDKENSSKVEITEVLEAQSQKETNITNKNNNSGQIQTNSIQNLTYPFYGLIPNAQKIKHNIVCEEQPNCSQTIEDKIPKYKITIIPDIKKLQITQDTENRTIPPKIRQIPSQISQIPPQISKISTQISQIPPQISQIPPQISKIPPPLRQIPSQIRQIPPHIRQIPSNYPPNYPPTPQNYLPPQRTNETQFIPQIGPSNNLKQYHKFLENQHPQYYHSQNRYEYQNYYPILPMRYPQNYMPHPDGHIWKQNQNLQRTPNNDITREHYNYKTNNVDREKRQNTTESSTVLHKNQNNISFEEEHLKINNNNVVTNKQQQKLKPNCTIVHEQIVPNETKITILENPNVHFDKSYKLLNYPKSNEQKRHHTQNLIEIPKINEAIIKQNNKNQTKNLPGEILINQKNSNINVENHVVSHKILNSNCTIVKEQNQNNLGQIVPEEALIKVQENPSFHFDKHTIPNKVINYPKRSPKLDNENTSRNIIQIQNLVTHIPQNQNIDKRYETLFENKNNRNLNLQSNESNSQGQKRNLEQINEINHKRVRFESPLPNKNNLLPINYATPNIDKMPIIKHNEMPKPNQNYPQQSDNLETNEQNKNKVSPSEQMNKTTESVIVINSSRPTQETNEQQVIVTNEINHKKHLHNRNECDVFIQDCNQAENNNIMQPCSVIKKVGTLNKNMHTIEHILSNKYSVQNNFKTEQNNNKIKILNTEIIPINDSRYIKNITEYNTQKSVIMTTNFQPVIKVPQYKILGQKIKSFECETIPNTPPPNRIIQRRKTLLHIDFVDTDNKNNNSSNIQKSTDTISLNDKLVDTHENSNEKNYSNEQTKKIRDDAVTQLERPMPKLIRVPPEFLHKRKNIVTGAETNNRSNENTISDNQTSENLETNDYRSTVDNRSTIDSRQTNENQLTSEIRSISNNRSSKVDKRSSTVDNRSSIIENSKEISDNQSLLCEDQSLISDKQDSIVVNRSLTINNKSSTVDNRHINNRRTIDYRNSTNDYQSSINENQSLTNKNQSLTNENQSLTNENQSSANEIQSSTNKNQSSTNENQSSTNENQSLTNDNCNLISDNHSTNSNRSISDHRSSTMDNKSLIIDHRSTVDSRSTSENRLIIDSRVNNYALKQKVPLIKPAHSNNIVNTIKDRSEENLLPINLSIKNDAQNKEKTAEWQTNSEQNKRQSIIVKNTKSSSQQPDLINLTFVKSEEEYKEYLQLLKDKNATGPYLFYEFVTSVRKRNNQPVFDLVTFFLLLKKGKLLKYKNMYNECNNK